MTYPDDVLKAAREAAAKVYESLGMRVFEEAVASGWCDDADIVQSACIAIMAERERVNNGG